MSVSRRSILSLFTAAAAAGAEAKIAAAAPFEEHRIPSDPVGKAIGSAVDVAQAKVPSAGSAPAILTDWEPDYSFRRYVTKDVWDALIGGEHDQMLSVQLQQAQDDVNSKGGGRIRLPAATLLIDGYKGAQSSYSNSRRGGLFVSDGVYWTGVKGKTVLKNAADGWTCLVSIRRGSNFGFKDIIFDGDRYNHPNARLATNSMRGEAIIFWNQLDAPCENIDLVGLQIRNTGHYGIGVQNVAVKGLRVDNCQGYDIGGDFIDIKDFAEFPKEDIVISRNAVRRIGTNWQERVPERAGPQAGFDIRGACLVMGNYIFDLDSYDESQSGNDGFRVNSNLSSNDGRRGGKRSILSSNYVISSKLANEGSNTQKRSRGFVIQDENVSVQGAWAENCFNGLVLDVGEGDSIPNGAIITGLHVKNSRGAAGDGIGITLGAGTSGHHIEAEAEGCDLGFTCSASRVSGRVNLLTNTTPHNIAIAVLSSSQLEISMSGNTNAPVVANAINNANPSQTIWASVEPWLNLRSTLKGKWPSPYGMGGMRWFKDDASQSDTGLVGQFEFRFDGPTAKAGGITASFANGLKEMVDTVQFRSMLTAFLTPVALPSYTLEQLLALTGMTNGWKAYVTNGRAFDGAGKLQPTNAGTGVEVSYSEASGAWQVVGTNVRVSA